MLDLGHAFEKLCKDRKGNHNDHRYEALAELAEKGSDIDELRQVVQFMAQRLMEMDVEGRCGAGYDEKNTEKSLFLRRS